MVDSVNLISEFVEQDLASDRFSDQDRRDFLNDVNELERQLTTWDRDLTKCCEILEDTPITIYRRRQGDIRHFYVRDGDTLHFIGVRKRNTVYDRHLDTIVERGTDIG
jgi:hypothetical protein